MATLNLIPNAAGDLTELTPTSGANYTNIDDPVGSPDYATTVVSTNQGVLKYDLYGIPDLSLSNITISNFALVVCGCLSHYGYLKTGGTGYLTSEFTSADIATYPTNTTNYSVNPYTGVTWTISDIDALQIGCATQGVFDGKAVVSGQITQVYGVLTYTQNGGIVGGSAALLLI